MKYYKVTCVRAHVGTGNHNNLISFFFETSSAFDAMQRGRRMPGVKHTRMPVSCVECTKEEYNLNFGKAYKEG